MEWSFDDAPDAAAFTVRQIIYEGSPILYASHNSYDGAWHFMPGFQVQAEDSVVVPLSQIVAMDWSIHELAGLPLGWTASRAFVGGRWDRNPGN